MSVCRHFDVPLIKKKGHSTWLQGDTLAYDWIQESG